MADSFFGFNTSIDELDDGGAFEASEDEYDALNDETFGEMGNDVDWEQQHEEFSILSEKNKHNDIEENLSNLILDNDELPISSAHPSVKLQSVPIPPLSIQNMPPISALKNVCTVEELERSLRQQPQQLPHMQQMSVQQQQQKPQVLQFFQQPRFPTGIMGPPPLMGNQPFGPHMPNQQHMAYRMPQPPINHMSQHYGNFNMMPPNNMPPGTGPMRPPMIPPGMDPAVFHQMHFNQSSNNMNQQRFPMNNQPMPLNPFPLNQQQFVHNQQFPPNQHFPPNQPPQFPHTQPPQMPMNPQNSLNPPHPPQMPMNPQLNQQQPPPQQQQQLIPPQNQNRNQLPPNAQPVPNQQANSKVTVPAPRQFNAQTVTVPAPAPVPVPVPIAVKNQNDTNSLIQMIQNTHPMLQNNINSNYVNAFIGHPLIARHMFHRHQQNNMPPGFNPQPVGTQKTNGNQRRQVLPESDPYSRLMTPREKKWLTNIQMMQLNTGTPYMDDYYYTMFNEKKSKEKEEVKEAHKVNQENHPFSQKNLANNKFTNLKYNNHGNDGEHRRERCNSTRSNSDNANQNKEGPRTYVPTQFENSLGKLQCGSVTAPRKIIDMEVIGRESPTGEVRTNSIGSSTAGVIGAPRGTRHVLLAIETLYRILLRLEDLSEPLAITNAVILKEREEKAKALLLEQQQAELEKNDDEEDADSHNDAANNFMKGIESVQKQALSRTQGVGLSTVGSNATNSVLPTHTVPTLPNLLDENKPDLLTKLFAGLLFEDRLLSFMNIRKGKMLVIRILAQAVPIESWRIQLDKVWPRLLRALPYALRRDVNLLNPLVHHFYTYLNSTKGWETLTDIFMMLSEESPLGLLPQRASSVPIRSVTPSLPSRSLMYFVMSTSLGLSLMVVLMEHTSTLPKPSPPAWNNVVRCIARLATASGNAHPCSRLSRSILSDHCAAAEVGPGIEESLAEVLSLF